MVVERSPVRATFLKRAVAGFLSSFLFCLERDFNSAFIPVCVRPQGGVSRFGAEAKEVFKRDRGVPISSAFEVVFAFKDSETKKGVLIRKSDCGLKP